MTEDEVNSNDPEHVWHLVTEEEIYGIAKALGQTQPEGFSTEQLTSVVNELVANRVGNILFFLVISGKLGIGISEGQPFFFAENVPTSKLNLVPGQVLKYTKFGMDHLKKEPADRVVFVRWIEEGAACMLKVRDSQGEVSNKKYLKDYLDFLTPVHELLPEPEQDWII